MKIKYIIWSFVLIFSCKNERHLLSEFFFLIANLYSAEEEYNLSNFYLIFYNNGDLNDIGEMDELSNRFFYIHRTEGPKAYQRNNSGGKT